MAAAAPPPCDYRANIVAYLYNKYQEKTVAGGLTAKGLMLELLRTESGDTWSLLVVQPNGLACLFASGQDWREKEPDDLDPEM